MQYEKDQIINKRYRIIRTLGSGGMGTTLLVFDEVDKKELALKILHQADISAIESFKQEFDTLTKFKHSGLVEVYEFGSIEGKEYFYTMEYIDGLDIKSFIKSNPITDESFVELCGIIIKILLALDFIHTKKILHGDLKPGNIFILKDKQGKYQPKLLDFGLSESFSLSKKGDFKGTAEYIAPEKIKEETIDGRSDLYSLGMVIYELLAGDMPYSYKNLTELLRKQLYEEVQSINSKIDIPTDFEKIILRLLRKQPANRYYSGYEVAKAISELFPEKLTIENREISDFNITSPEFIGRENEFKILLDSYNGSSSQSRMVFVSGATGIGKTRFIKEFKTYVQINGGRCIDVKCSEKILHPYKPILNILSQVKNYFDENESFLLNYKSLFEYIEYEFADKQDNEQSFGKESFILFLVDFLIEAARKIPYTVLIEDIQNIDSASLDFLNYLSGNISAQKSSGLIFVFSFNSDVQIPDMLQNLLESENILKIDLKGIERTGITKYLVSALGLDNIPEKFIDLMESNTGGNFYLLEELLRGLLKDGFLSRKYGDWIINPGYEEYKFSSGFSDIYRKKIEKLSDKERDFLFKLSILTTNFDRKVINNLVQLNDIEIQEITAKFISEEFLAAEKNQYYFKNQKMKDFIYSEFEAQKKKSAHLLILQYYENLYSDCKDKYIELFAHHLFFAEKYSEALPLLLSSGEKARKIFANKEAEEYYKKALSAIEKVNANEIQQKLNIYNILFDVYDLLGDRESQSETIENMLVLSARLNDEKQMSDVYIKQSKYFYSIGQYDKAKKSGEKALEIKQKINDRKGIADSYVTIGSAQFKAGQVSEFVESYSKAMDDYKSMNLKPELANSFVDMGIAYLWNLDTPETAIKYFNDAYNIFKELGNTRGQIRTLGNIGLAYSSMRKYEESLNYYNQVYDLCQKIGDKRGISTVFVNIGKSLVEMGEYSEALNKLTNGLVLVRKLDDKYSEEAYLENLGFLYNFLGKYQDAIGYFNSAILIAEKIGNDSGLSGNCTNICQCYLNVDDLINAEKYLNMAHSFINDDADYNTKINFLIIELLYNLKLKNKGNLNKAKDTAKEIIDLSRKSSDYDSLLIAFTNLALVFLEQKEVEKALEQSLNAISLINEINYKGMDVAEIYWNHYNIMKSKNQINLGKESLKKSYEIIMSRAKGIKEIELKESYLESAHPNKEIISEYKKVFAESNPSDIAAQNKIRNLETLYEISRTITSVHDINELLNLVMDLALQTLRGERGLIFLLENGRLELKVARNVERQTIEDASQISESIIKDVANGGKPVLTLDAKGDERFKQRLSVMNFQITSLVCVPIKLKEKILGTVYVDGSSTPKSIVAFTAIDQEFLEAFANIVAISIENARLLEKLREENVYLRSEVETKFRFENIIGSSPAIEKIYKVMEGAIKSEGTVLIQGESGTGKELIARAIHYNSKRKKEKFIAVDCASLHDTLLDSELFGHKKGSFTGAISDKKGLFEEASGGTIFLDEITNTNLGFQAKLLRVLQEGEIRRVGETESRFVDVRVIVAANKNIEEEISAGRFREDLFYRLNVIPIFVPTLRERKEDIYILIDHFIKKYSAKSEKKISGVTQELVDILTQYDWPGNVRELENIINRMIIFAEDDKLSAKDIPADFMRSFELSKSKYQEIDSDNRNGKAPTMKEIEKDHILRILEQTKGNKTEAAKLLGLKRTTLVERMKKLGLM